MNKPLIAAALLAAAFAAQPANAQSFLKRLTGAAAQTLLSQAPRPEDLAERAAAEVIGAVTAPKTERAAPKPKRAPRAKLPSDIKPSSEAAEEKQRFVEFSRYACNDCEGGRGYDAWARQILNLPGDHAWEEKVGALAIGEAIQWQGKESDGTLTAVAEAEIDGLRCKRVQWTLVRRSDQRTAGREGLFCFGRPDRYVDTERWVEVY